MNFYLRNGHLKASILKTDQALFTKYKISQNLIGWIVDLFTVVKFRKNENQKTYRH